MNTPNMNAPNADFYMWNYKKWLAGDKIEAEAWFVREFAIFANSFYNVKYSTGFAIADSIIGRMSETGLFYHTPPHIVNLFGMAKELEIELEPWEKMAIWFHDAIYAPGTLPGTSESCSANFFQALMKPYILKEDRSVDYNELLKVSTAITMTANHCETLEKTDPMWFRILDLDLMGFALPPEQNDYFNNLVKQEFLAFGAQEKDYNIGRKAFLEKLISKGYIFRTEFFKDKFEAIAMENVKNGLNGI